MNSRLRQVLPAFLLGLSLFAAPPQPRSQLQNMIEKLSVTAEQKLKLDPILDEDAKAVRALRNAGLPDEERSKKTAAIRAETDSKIKPILTGDQWQKLQQLREERKAQGKKK